MKWIAIITSALILAAATACGGGDSDSTQTNGEPSAATSLTSAPSFQNTPTPTPPPGPLEMTEMACTAGKVSARVEGHIIGPSSAAGRVRNVSGERLTDLRAQLVLIDSSRKATIPYLERGPYTGISYEASPMPVFEGPDPDFVAKSSVALEPSTLGPGDEAAISFPDNVIGLASPGTQCTIVFLQCVPACKEVRAKLLKVNITR